MVVLQFSGKHNTWMFAKLKMARSEIKLTIEVPTLGFRDKSPLNE